jgi:hypothetical protein
MDQALKQENIPSGGIADFIYTDEEIKLLEDKELQDLYGQNGIAQFKTIGKEMANFGRYGDDTIAHVETGELIVPRALIENNPKLKESIFGHLRELGVEDPERYVVGTSKNSLNPETGLPEFFLKKLFKGAKKAVSSVAKGVSSALKGVGKALKKVAPIVVPIALNYFLPGLGQIYSGALGAGITSLLQGGSVKDAFKSALLGGATGAISAGFSGPRSGLDGFGKNIMSDVNYGTQNIKNAFTQGSFKPLTDSSLTSVRDLFSEDTAIKSDTTLYDGTKPESMIPEGRNLSAKSTESIGTKVPMGTDPYVARGLSPEGVKPLITDAGIAGDLYSTKLGGADLKDFGFQTDNFYGKGNLELNLPRSDIPGFTQQLRGGDPTFGFQTTNVPPKPQTFFDRTKDFIFGKDASRSEILTKAGELQTEAAAKNLTLSGKQAIELAEKELAPSFLEKYGPSTALGIAALSGSGAFDVPEQERIDDIESGYDVFQRDRDKYLVGGIPSSGSSTNMVAQSRFPFDYTPYTLPGFPIQRVAEGGEIFPRRNGGISPREGTPGKDSVRAMLMPGEFVMTTDAVRGLGGGNLDKGIKNMYSVMSKLEKRGKAMA